MESSTSSTVQSLNASGSSRVHVGNSYSITHHHGRGSDDDGAKKYLEELRSTDPRDDKARIEQTNGGLLKDSYVWILDSPEFITWRDESKAGRLLWIRGDPGKGKTMLLCGLVNELQPLTRLDGSQNSKTVSYFFCQATNSGLNNYTAILKGLIYLLVIQHPTAVSHLDDKEDKDHWNYKVSLEGTFRKILEDPGLGEVYLLVDALDECVEDLPLLLALISSTSSRAKWIATSRNRCEIEELFGEASSKLALSLELHEGSVSRAVDSYINYRTRQLAERKKLKKSTLQQIHDHLSQHAHGTFLWVALVCQRLERCRAWEIPNQLSQFPQGLNQLYAKMMEQIHKSVSCDLYIRILAVASTVFRPLTFAELIAMEDLQIDEELVPDLIVECGSFLTTKESSVVFIHQSAKDFLLRESSTLLFQSGLAHHQYNLFERCIAMLQSLHPDIYGLVYPGVSLKEALRNCPDPDPLETIKYSCVFWADHMQEAYKLSIQSEENSDIRWIDTVHGFINEKFLFWLEALALCRNLSAALKALVFVRDLPVQGQGSYKALIEDALRFSHYFSSIIERYPLQAYASGLLFSPSDSLIRRRFEQYTSKIFSQGPKVDNKWSPIRSVFAYDGLEIRSMSFAPTSQILVINAWDTLVRWNVSQEPIPNVMEREGVHEKIALSSDGKWLAIIDFDPSSEFETDQSSAQYELQIHDWTLNRITWRQELDNPEVLGMAISPDSQYLLLCYETILVIYDIGGGLRRRYTLEKALPYSGPARYFDDIYFSFSSDGSWVAFHMRHKTQIWVLNLRTGKQYNNGNWKDISPINDTKFIPSTHLLMFCDSGNNIYHWNVVEQNCEMWSHIDYSFSHLAIPHSDSWMLLSGPYGLFICDRSCRRARQVVGLPWLPDWEAIAISFDDQAIACGFQTEIWILNTNTLLADEQSATQDTYRKLHISDNGQLIAHDLGRNVEVWDALTGDMLCSLTLDDVNRPSIQNITFAPKDRYLLVSGLQSILGWDLDDESSQRVSGDFGSGPIAVSDSGYNGDRWAAARQSMGDVSVWNLTTLEQNRIFRQPDNLSQEAASIAFAGNQLGILWISKKGSPGTSPFLLYDVGTGQQLSGINFVEYYGGTRLSLFNKPKLKLFLSGTWVMFHPGPNTSLFFLKMSTDGNKIEVRNRFWHVSLLDDSTVSTDQGVWNGQDESGSPRAPRDHFQ
ncbi:heterokaryon incompatibility protein het-E-1 [Fusarium tjaetaba]|uniref:Heterokaryon incompatibility protein het-E-1 n=1 Tax=Fusarium tjaetaba TaxID=1567544 RepID=A0A8H5QUL6_9HYPO|nr:heterokaryon incompatibility protein het-E-1 [Fusarium tjaetaba]KAF5621058.1 heterokaryon incompatibility protein het-E-1 [Fusarium tjaetaba]